MLTSHKEIGQIIQTRKGNQRRRDFRGGGDKNKSCGYCGRKGKHEPPEGCLAWIERRGTCQKENNFAKVWKQKASTQLYQLEYSEESSSNESTYIIQEEIANSEAKKKRRVAPTLMRKKISKHAVECQIDSGASCNIILHSLVCKLLEDVNPKFQESKSKLRMYDRSVMIL